MKKLFTVLSFVSLSLGYTAQINSVATDFTVTDINGTTHNLYTYLNQNKLVILDASATWCSNCWNFHNANYLKDLYEEFGPNGTNQIVVIFYEADANTGSNQLNGTGGNTQGNWTTNSPYPIINESPLQLTSAKYWPTGFPSVNVICQNDKKIIGNLKNQQSGGYTGMRAYVQQQITACQIQNLSVEEQQVMNASISPNPTQGIASVRINQTNVNVNYKVINLAGQVVLTGTEKTVDGFVNVDLSSMDNGSYFIELSVEGINAERVQVVKN